MKKITEEALSTYITEELIASKRARITFKQTGMTRAELSQFIDGYLSACDRYYVGGDVYADPTYDGVLVYEN